MKVNDYSFTWLFWRTRIAPHSPLAHFLSLEHEHLSPVHPSSLCVHFSKCLVFQFSLTKFIHCCWLFSLTQISLSYLFFCLLFVWVVEFCSNMTLCLAHFCPIILKFYLVVVGLRGAWNISSKHFWTKSNISWEQQRNSN